MAQGSPQLGVLQQPVDGDRQGVRVGGGHGETGLLVQRNERHTGIEIGTDYRPAAMASICAIAKASLLAMGVRTKTCAA